MELFDSDEFIEVEKKDNKKSSGAKKSSGDKVSNHYSFITSLISCFGALIDFRLLMPLALACHVLNFRKKTLIRSRTRSRTRRNQAVAAAASLRVVVRPAHRNQAAAVIVVIVLTRTCVTVTGGAPTRIPAKISGMTYALLSTYQLILNGASVIMKSISTIALSSTGTESPRMKQPIFAEMPLPV